MVVSKRGSYGTVSAASRPAGFKASATRFVARNSNVLLLGLVACAVLSLGWRPLHGPRGSAGQPGGGALGRRAQERGGQEELGTAAEVAATVASSAGVYGFVHKDGVADVRNWHPKYKAYRQERLADWLAQRQAALAEGSLLPPLPIYTGCQVYINHLYKIIYLRHAKTASSSLFCHFGGCRAANDTSSDSSSGGPSKKALSFELLQAGSLEEVGTLWRDYFVVTFVRNPYQRAVSSYRMMARQLALGGPVAERYGWDAFCADPTGFADECMTDEQCKKKGRNFVYVHIQPQHDCIITESGGWAVDFIGRVESIDEDLRAVLEELERRRPAEAPPVRPLEGSLENVNGRGCNESAADAGHSIAREQYCEPWQYYDGKHASCFSQVRHHYYSDAHSLRFGPGEKQDVAEDDRR